MRKGKTHGFIFTIDAIAAVAIVIVLAVTWSIAVRAKAVNKYFAYVDKVARDESLVAIYTHNLRSDFFQPLDVNTDMICRRYFTLMENDKYNDKGVNINIICIADTVVLP